MKITALVWAFVFASTAFAGGFTSQLTIDTLQTHQDYFEVVAANSISNPDSATQDCTGTTKVVFGRTLTQYEEVVSVLLAAKLADKKVSLFVTSCFGAKMNGAYVMLH